MIPIVCRVLGEHGKGRNTHGKMFTVRNTWQTTHGIDRQAKGTFYRVYFCAHGKQISEKNPATPFATTVCRRLARGRAAWSSHRAGGRAATAGARAAPSAAASPVAPPPRARAAPELAPPLPNLAPPLLKLTSCRPPPPRPRPCRLELASELASCFELAAGGGAVPVQHRLLLAPPLLLTTSEGRAEGGGERR